MTGNEAAMTRCLHEAVKKQQYDLVVSFLSQPEGLDVNARDGYGMTALMWAAGRGYREIAEVLLTHNPDLEAGNELVSVKTIEKLEGGKGDYWELIDRMGMLHAKKHYGWTALAWAARNGQTAIMSLLLDSGANINAITKDGFTALVHAIENKHSETAHLLLERGANPNLVEDGCSPALPVAARHGLTSLVRVILEHGGSLSSFDNFGHIALSNAIVGNHTKILLLLLQRGADADSNFPEEVKFPPLHTAAARDALECAEILLNYGANINAKDELNGATALQWALSEFSSPRVARLLIERGANIQGAMDKAEYARGTAEPDEIAEADELIALLKDRAETNR